MRAFLSYVVQDCEAFRLVRYRGRGEHLSFNALSASLGCFCGVASSHSDVGALLCAVEVSDLL